VANVRRLRHAARLLTGDDGRAEDIAGGDPRSRPGRWRPDGGRRPVLPDAQQRQPAAGLGGLEPELEQLTG
jgi:hypothetical protein